MAAPFGPAGVVLDDPRSDPRATWREINDRRRVMDAEARMPSLYRIWDKGMRYIGTVHTHKSFDGEVMEHDSGQGDVVLRGSDWLIKFLRTDIRAKEDLNFTVDPYPHRRNWRDRIGFKVTDVKVAKDEDGERTVTLSLIENREHWKHILFGATVFAPPEAQPIKCFLMPANCRTAIATAGAANLARQFNPALAVFTNLLNPGAYVGAALGLGLPGNWAFLNHPLQMQFVNPVTDTSRLSVLMSRWQDAHSVTEAMLRDANCHVRPYVWLEEDEDSPHPELAMLVGEKLARPRRNCIVFAVEEIDQYHGITGLAPDGAIKLIAATGDDLVGEVLYSDANGDGENDPLIRKWLLAAPEPPTLVFRDGERSAIISSERHMYKATAKTIMTGGKSPQWLNQVQTFLVRYALSKIAEAVAMFGQIPLTEGIENVYQNQGDDMWFAFIRYTDVNRVLNSDDFGFLEEFVQGSGSAYVIATPLTIREGLEKTKAHQVFKTTVRNGRPHRVFIDYRIGTPALTENDGVLIANHISAIKLHEDESTPKTFDISIGDDRQTESGLAAATRTAQEFWNGLATMMGQETNF
ncbi:minor tail protein [Mycobacterium phage Cambiare]|uniref:Minor tail protein n=2 Tax=Avocadovirus TaxID=2946813 RepID=A0A222YZJ7_9CAUD|nr:minor tail protein [Mycobacterium phage Cambiare]YP_010051490.1 minor tail protein [Mycobacterium phage Avocado]AKF14521.1 minor tail protein [Mycobacterium phage Cambiare]ASR77220.1 minor tail protein [Mycobacterium phage Avocado]